MRNREGVLGQKNLIIQWGLFPNSVSDKFFLILDRRMLGLAEAPLKKRINTAY
jgi:hypothetical protein